MKLTFIWLPLLPSKRCNVVQPIHNAVATFMPQLQNVLFEHCLASGEFPNVWEKSNIVSVHKNGDKQLIKNCLPVSLLPICVKLMEKLMFNSIFSFTDTRNMFSVHQSRLHRGDS